MSKISSFKELVLWQKSMELANEIFQITEQFPKEEKYGLTSQMRRSAISIPSNIAEGHKRGTRKDFCHFLKISSGSAAELETQLLLANSWYHSIQNNKAFELLVEVQKILTVMIRKLET